MNVDVLTVEIVLGIIVVLALFGFFLRRVSQELGSVEHLSREMESIEREQRRKQAEAMNRIKKTGVP